MARKNDLFEDFGLTNSYFDYCCYPPSRNSSGSVTHGYAQVGPDELNGQIKLGSTSVQLSASAAGITTVSMDSHCERTASAQGCPDPRTASRSLWPMAAANRLRS